MYMEIIEKLRKIKDRFDNINQQLSDPDILSDREKVVSLSKERSDLLEIVGAYE
jgi:peptide chain release factor 1